MIPDDVVERVRESADIVQVIGEHVSLKRVGADYRGPCPFHQGTHRNFSVSPRKRMYYCFVCHEGGDVFNFLQKRLGLDWPAAVRLVAEKSGIEVREVDARREGPDPRERYWEVNAAAAEYFQRVLWDDPLGEPAREYVTGRRVSRETADRFSLGFAPREIGLLRGHLNALGYDDERLLDAGLLVRPEEGSEPRPRFRNRLIFPILDAAGRHVGFGGRLLGQGEPKYLNSAESAIFSKGKLLYNLHRAKHAIRRDERALIVEGYFDVVRLVAAGVEPVVAPLGTALTADQAALVARYTKNAFLLYDSDKAGLKATFRAGDELLGHGVAVQVVTLPVGEDPDTFVDKHGAHGLEAQLGSAVDVFERRVQELERRGWFADLRNRRRAIDKLLPTLRATVDPVTRDLYLARASEASGVSKEVLVREMGHPGAARPRAPRERAAPRAEQMHARLGERRAGDRRAGDRRARTAVQAWGAERELVRVMLHYRDHVDAIAERISERDFRDAHYRAIFAALVAAGADASVDDVAARLDEESVAELEELLGAPDAIVVLDATVDGALAAFRVRDLTERIERLRSEMRIGSVDEQRERDREIEQLRAEIRALGGRGFRWFRSVSN